METNAASSKEDFYKDEILLCWDEERKRLFEARCLRTEVKDGHKKYRVHFFTYPPRPDEWVGTDRLLKHGPHSLKTMEALDEQHPRGKVSKDELSPVKTAKNAPGPDAEEEVPFKTGENIFCFDRHMLYEAKVLKCRDRAKNLKEYRVHFQGWNKRHDRWLTDNLMFKNTPENAKQSASIKLNHEKKVELIEQEEKRQREAEAKVTAALAAPKEPVRKTGAKQPKLSVSTDVAAEVPAEITDPPVDPHVETLAEWRERSEYKFKIPELLQSWLMEDWKLISKGKKLTDLYRQKTVDQLLNDYREIKSKFRKRGSLIPVENGTQNEPAIKTELATNGEAGSEDNSTNSSIDQKKTPAPTVPAAEAAQIDYEAFSDWIKLHFNYNLPYILYPQEKRQYQLVLEQMKEDDIKKEESNQENNADATRFSAYYGISQFLRFLSKFGTIFAEHKLEQAEFDILSKHLHDLMKFMAREEVFNSGVYRDIDQNGHVVRDIIVENPYSEPN